MEKRNLRKYGLTGGRLVIGMKRDDVNGNLAGKASEFGKVVSPVRDSNGKVTHLRFGLGSWGSLRGKINQSLRPQAPVKTLDDMTEEEKQAIEERYNAKIKR